MFHIFFIYFIIFITTEKMIIVRTTYRPVRVHRNVTLPMTLRVIPNILLTITKKW